MVERIGFHLKQARKVRQEDHYEFKAGLGYIEIHFKKIQTYKMQ